MRIINVVPEMDQLQMGKQGENKSTKFLFDVSDWLEKYPGCTITLVNRRPNENSSYPCVLTTEEDGRRGWVINSADLAIDGKGECELKCTLGDMIEKDKRTWKTTIKKSLSGEGDAPEPWESVMDDIEALVGDAQDAAEDAETAKEAAEEAAGIAAHAPIIQDGYWYVWDATTEQYVNSEVKAQGQDATPALIAVEYSDLTFPVAEGKLCYYSGLLYKANQAIATREEWTAAHWTQTTIEAEQSSLLTEINSKADEPTGTKSAGKVYGLDSNLNPAWVDGSGSSVDLFYVTPEQYGAKGDGVTDDSQAVQDAVDAGYAVYFASGKTYYLASTVTIDHDCHLFGGENTVIKTKTPQGGEVNTAIAITGDLVKETTLTTDYISHGYSTNNCSNKLTLEDMQDIQIGDVIVVTATDQYYEYTRRYYYLGASLKVTDIYDGHIYVNMNMPFDITLTENVTVSVYRAPSARIENLHFVSDLDSIVEGTYNSCLSLARCRDSSIVNCTFSNFVMGVYLYYCVNTLVDNVQLSKSKYSNELTHDGYGLAVNSCTQTIVKRIVSLCSQGCINLTGTIPNIDTFISKCNVASEARSIGIDMHENIYNIVVEDCSLGGLSGSGTIKIKRCRFYLNARASTSSSAITFRGGHNPAWSTLDVEDCEFSGTLSVTIDAPSAQNGVQSFDAVVGYVRIKNCKGGSLFIIPQTSADVLSNTIKKIIIENWQDCYEIYHPGDRGVIEYLQIVDSTITKQYIINDHNDSHGIVLDNLWQLEYRDNPVQIHKICVNKPAMADKAILPENIPIYLSSNNQNAKYVICGNNMRSDNIEDYRVGGVSGSVGGNISRTDSSGSYAIANVLDKDENGNFVYTQPNGDNKYSVYPIGFFYAREKGSARISTTIKKLGEASGSSWACAIAVINPVTGKLTYRNNGSYKQATTDGIEISHAAPIEKGEVFMCYLYCTWAVANAITTFEDFKVSFNPRLSPPVVDQSEAYKAKRLTGDGSLASYAGVNNIMSSELNFTVKYQADVSEVLL